MRVKEIILSIPLSEVIITGNRMVYTQLTSSYDIANIKNIRCDPRIGDQKSYFKVYALEFSKPTPYAEFVDHVFCALIQ
jgi:hypothetical protein